jgi:transcriptional regulator of arginine metabolism
MTAVKADRQAAIRRILRDADVGTQADLRRALRAGGFRVDQSTLSRDLVELGIRKADGRYLLPNGQAKESAEPAFSSAVVGYTSCGPHLIVIRTALGAAQPLAVRIDQAAEPSIVATLAGDDTIFVATRSRRTQVVALRRLEQWFGDRHEH